MGIGGAYRVAQRNYEGVGAGVRMGEGEVRYMVIDYITLPFLTLFLSLYISLNPIHAKYQLGN
jgi:hypothetical protein